jgi:hypothetical protein
MSPKKTPTQEVKQERVVLTSKEKMELKVREKGKSRAMYEFSSYNWHPYYPYVLANGAFTVVKTVSIMNKNCLELSLLNNHDICGLTIKFANSLW